MKIYLCGGINGLSDSDAMNWREEAKVLLKHDTIDPMRRDYRGKELANFELIVKNDLIDIGNADLILVNASRPSWGTAMEIVYAYGKKPIVAFLPDVDRASPWLRYHCNELYSSSIDAIKAINNWIIL